jgi:hypothetical protein
MPVKGLRGYVARQLTLVVARLGKIPDRTDLLRINVYADTLLVSGWSSAKR